MHHRASRFQNISENFDVINILAIYKSKFKKRKDELYMSLPKVTYLKVKMPSQNASDCTT